MHRCLFCRRAFDPDAGPLAVPARRMAYDVRRHRVWAICNHCERWTLLLPEDRPAALHHLQRIAKIGRAHV